MDLKNKFDDFRQLQAQRKSAKNKKQKNLKMEFTAFVKAEAGLPTYQAKIMVNRGYSITIVQQHAVNGFPRRSILFIADDAETHYSDGNMMEINFKSESQKPDPQLFFDNTEQRKSFEIAYKTFMGYSNPEDVNP